MRVRSSQIRPLRQVLAGLFVGVIGLMGPTAFADDLPKAEEVIEKYIKATGGKAAYEKRKDMTTTSTIDFKATGAKAKAVAYQAPPATNYTVVEIDGVGKFENGCDGKIAWSNSEVTGPQVKEGSELEFAIRTSTFNSDLNWRTLYKSAETIGTEEIDGKKAYKLKLTPPKGKDDFQFFDVESGLLVKSTSTMQSQMGELAVESKYAEYKEFDGVRVPTKVTQVLGGGLQSFEVTIEKIEINTNIPASKFEPPTEIKELLNKPKAASSKPADDSGKTTPEPKTAEPKKAEPKKDEPKKAEPKKP